MYRQEVFNVLLAQLLQERGAVSAPENIIKLGGGKSRKMPDVIVTFRGLRTALEGEVDDQGHAHDKALAAARQRVETGIAHIGVAVVYPQELRNETFERLKEKLAAAKLSIAIVTESHSTGFVAGTVDYLESALRNAFEHLVREDIVTQAVEALDKGIEDFASLIAHKRGVVGRAAHVLGIRQLSEESSPDRFSTEERWAISRIAGLVLVNAMIFQEILTEDYPRITPLSRIIAADPFSSGQLIELWDFVIRKIDYYPIFFIARELLLDFGSTVNLKDLMPLILTTGRIIGLKAALRHDLMGRIYHRLLVEAKYLGTYYTSIPAATLLLKLALRPAAWPFEPSDLAEVRRLRIADLSCGTGTLLMAAADAMTDNYISAAAGRQQAIDANQLQAALVEEMLHGYDVLPSAIHLTASSLAMRSPSTAFKNMNLFSLPLGGPDSWLGSVEYLTGSNIQIATDISGATPATQQATPSALQEVLLAPLPDLDLVAINPPFTRSVGGNLLFGSVPAAEREKMQKKLARLLKETKALANTTAGLGSIFVAIAHRFIKPGGRLALVLPKTLLSGEAWGKTRELIQRHYEIEFIIASHDPSRWNFSESTDLSETLLVAVKNQPGKTAKNGRVIAVNLWHNPRTTFEALAVAQALTENGVPDLESGQGALNLFIGEHKIGEAVALPWRELNSLLKLAPEALNGLDPAKISGSDWSLPVNFAQADLARAAYYLEKGQVWLPGYEVVGHIPLRPLSDFGTLGPDRRDIHDGFSLSQTPTAYPCLWGHDAGEVVTLAQTPNHYLAPLPQAKEGRSLRKVKDLWPLAGRVAIVERLRLNSHKLLAVKFPELMLSNVWWTFCTKQEFQNDTFEKALVLWLNSTFNLLLLLAHREETEGAWIGFKKPTLGGLPVLDLSSLEPAQLDRLAGVYDRIAGEALATFARMGADPVRLEIDRAVAEVLGLPDLAVLRRLLAQEPVICLKKLGV